MNEYSSAHSTKKMKAFDLICTAFISFYFFDYSGEISYSHSGLAWRRYLVMQAYQRTCCILTIDIHHLKLAGAELNRKGNMINEQEE